MTAPCKVECPRNRVSGRELGTTVAQDTVPMADSRDLKAKCGAKRESNVVVSMTVIEIQVVAPL